MTCYEDVLERALREAMIESERLTIQVDALNRALCKSGDERMRQDADIEGLKTALWEVREDLAHLVQQVDAALEPKP